AGWLANPPARAQDDGSSDSGSSGRAPAPIPKIAAVSFVTWWSHDAVGYHPAIVLRYENQSDRDLTGVRISFQAKFTDLRNGYVTVARQQTMTSLPPGAVQNIMMRAPTSFELPIDQAQWPSIECKVMCRVGEVGDEGTQDILIANLVSVVMTDDEAVGKLAERPNIQKLADTQTNSHRNRPGHDSRHSSRQQPPPADTSPLSAGQPMLSLASAGKIEEGHKASMVHMLSGKNPGLGDDFYNFEQAYGRPAGYGSSPISRWTWARYVTHNPPMEIYVGAKSGSSVAQAMVVNVQQKLIASENQVVLLAKALAGKFKSQVPESARHSVKYLPSGRVEFSTLAGPSFHALYFAPRSSNPNESNYILVMSKEPGNLEQTVGDYIKGVSMLSFLRPLLGEAE
ncbi:MAG TPA: hypothetical protein V6C72_05455, partial [Chroococcales cyanobacterium]